MHEIANTEELLALIGQRRIGKKGADAGPLVPRGGGTKPSLSSAPGAELIDLRGLTGILAYQPSEFTMTVRAGTLLREIDQALRENGQSLPFDPPFIDSGSTAGGTVATGISGPGRLRGGGVRDAVLAVRFIDGRGRHARAGAPVVKNAAGFDLPKLFVGSLGRLAILTEVTFKVLPAPSAFKTGLFAYQNLEAARAAAVSLLGQPFMLDGLEILPPQIIPESIREDSQDDRWLLALRLGGEPSSLDRRLDRIAGQLKTGPQTLAEDRAFWRQRRDVEWAAPEKALLWIPTTAGCLLTLHEALQDFNVLDSDQSCAQFAYAGGLSAAWVAIETDAVPALGAILTKLDLSALVLRSPEQSSAPILGRLAGETLLRRVKESLDPSARLGSYRS